jgi:hypothetical protein
MFCVRLCVAKRDFILKNTSDILRAGGSAPGLQQEPRFFYYHRDAENTEESQELEDRSYIADILAVFQYPLCALCASVVKFPNWFYAEDMGKSAKGTFRAAIRVV